MHPLSGAVFCLFVLCILHDLRHLRFAIYAAQLWLMLGGKSFDAEVLMLFAIYYLCGDRVVVQRMQRAQLAQGEAGPQWVHPTHRFLRPR